MFSTEELHNLLSQLDGSGSTAERSAIRELKELGPDLVSHLAELYGGSKRAPTRSSCLYYSMPYAKESDAAVDLGILALADRSKIVRYRACMLLAFSQNSRALPALRQAAQSGAEASREDFLAAVDAIESENHHYFLDRDHSGMVKMNIVTA